MKKNVYKFFILLFLGFFIMGQEFSFGCIDFAKPKVAVMFPSNNSTIYGVVTIIASPSDNVGVSKVEFYIDGVKVGEDTSSPYEYSWDTVNLPYDSRHTIQVKAYDSAGNIGESAVITVRIGDPNIPVWQKVYGGSNFDVAYSIQQTADGGYIVAGETLSFGAGLTNVYILKLNGSGEEEWYRIYGGDRWDYAYSIQQTTDGGYILAGETDSFGKGRSDFYIIKLDNKGNKVWEKTYGGSEVDYAYSIQQTKDGGYIVAGSTESFGSGEYDLYVIKLDSNGNKIWERTYGGNASDVAYSIQQTTDGGYIVVGYTESFGAGEYDFYVIKLDNNGNKTWEKIYGGKDSDVLYSIQETTDGGYILVGYIESLNKKESDFYILKIDNEGNKVWEKVYGGNERDYAYSIQQTTDGGYIVVGSTESFGAGWYDVYVIKLDKNGEKEWEKTYGENSLDYAYSIQQTRDGGYIISGSTESFGIGSSDVYVIKTDPLGNTGPNPLD